MKKAFTLIELIFAIVIIGVLATVAIPKFSGLSNNSKIAAELSTASSVQVALDACHGEWIINEGDFTCGVNINSASDLTDTGYPKQTALTTSVALDKILRNPVGWTFTNPDQYRGPASNNDTGVSESKCKDEKPCIGKYWRYDQSNGTFTLTP
ncbi:MAG: type II secretion system protein [Campylobacterota bacterium]|nr:type II secretion system protein [Campylobacterota bacterium]